MHEQDKLDEAQYFLRHLSGLPEPKSFQYELSAFLTAARTALQYALVEAKKSGGQAWYDGQVSGNPVVKFFKDKRNFNIHDQPVVPKTSANLTLCDGASISTSVHLVVKNPEGQVVQEVTVGSQPSPPPSPRPPEITYSYAFADWSRQEDVMALSNRYLAEVQSIISDGVAKGYLTR